MNNTSTIPWLPTTSSTEEAAVGLAEQIAAMLHTECPVMVLITGSDSGRVSGFLAELTHAVSDTDTVLRIKASIDIVELFTLLAGQLNLCPQGLNSMQLATTIGNRLQKNAPSGHFVLLCEGAHGYTNAVLEGIRQLSNYPINIVLSGRPNLYRRLWRPALSALRRRMNYHLDLNEWRFTRSFKWLLILFVISAMVFLVWKGFLQQSDIALKPVPIKVIAVQPQNSVVVRDTKTTLGPNTKKSALPTDDQDRGLSLIMDPILKSKSKP